MALTKEKKTEVLNDLKENLKDQKSMVFLGIDGLKVKDVSDLRLSLKKVGSKLMVSKKTLLGLAFKEKGIDVDTKSLEGEAAVVFGKTDETSAAKAVCEFMKKNQVLKLLGGYLENRFFNASEMTELSKIPSREILIGQVASCFNGPVRGFHNVLSGNLRKLVVALSAIRDQKQ